jgi:hypothetical protein
MVGSINSTLKTFDKNNSPGSTWAPNADEYAKMV